MQFQIGRKGKHALAGHFVDERRAIHCNYSRTFSLELLTNRPSNSLGSSGH
ncbi:hypothetical protein D3C76_1312010 [compost metagenome]